VLLVGELAKLKTSVEDELVAAGFSVDKSRKPHIEVIKQEEATNEGIQKDEARLQSITGRLVDVSQPKLMGRGAITLNTGDIVVGDKTISTHFTG